MISMTCPSCQKRLQVPDNLAGETRECPNCKVFLVIPKQKRLVDESDSRVGHQSPTGTRTATAPQVVPPPSGEGIAIAIYCVAGLSLIGGVICLLYALAKSSYDVAAVGCGAIVSSLSLMGLAAIVQHTGRAADALERLSPRKDQSPDKEDRDGKASVSSDAGKTQQAGNELDGVLKHL